MHYNIVKKASRPYLEEMYNKAHEMPEIWKCINVLQKTPFKVNTAVLEVAKTLWGKGLTVGRLPSSVAEEVPPKPFDIDTNIEARREWSKIKRAIFDANETRESKILLTDAVIKIATEFQQHPNVYFPGQYDWRGRYYSVPQFFNVQNNDLARGLLLFSTGKQLGSNEALSRLAIHGANTFGEADKDTLQNRVKWVETNQQRIIDAANDPHEHYDFWGKCSEPFQFLAFCFEWRDFVKFGETSDFITNLPCYSDCTNSGLQILSALLADEKGGEATNLVPSEKPRDVYKEVADETLRLLKEAPDSIEKDMWLEYGIDRYTTKKVTMCVVYALTKWKGREYLEEYLKENEVDGIENPFSTDRNKKEGVPTSYVASTFITNFVWDALANVIKKSREAMDWLKEVTKLVCSDHKPIHWTTPTGFLVSMKCSKTVPKRINTNMGEKIWRPKLNKYVDDIKKTTIRVDTDKIDVEKAKNTISSCFVHSLDASVLQRAVCKAYDEGITNFAVIHDSFGVLAPDVDLMNKTLRESFVDIFHNKNLLKEFYDEIYTQVSKDKRSEIPAVPEKGKLDVSQVMHSNYFCS